MPRSPTLEAGQGDLPYIGAELELFAEAHNWKRYFAAALRPYIAGDVLEVGAGIGGTTAVLCTGRERSWTCLEPDRDQCGRIETAVATGRLPAIVRAMPGTLAGLRDDLRFDSVLYIDVLEHIEDDRTELLLASERLSPGARLVVLAPAHQALFSPFDAAVGHFRRYSKAGLLALAPPGLSLERALHLDSLGLLASAANRLLLGRRLPTRGQIAFWDGALTPFSRLLDPLLGHAAGKTVIAVWRKGP